MLLNWVHWHVSFKKPFHADARRTCSAEELNLLPEKGKKILVAFNIQKTVKKLYIKRCFHSGKMFVSRFNRVSIEIYR